MIYLFSCRNLQCKVHSYMIWKSYLGKLKGVRIELKAIEQLKPVHKTQAINYCEAYNIADGLVINFGAMSLEFKRVYNKNLVHPSIK